MVTAAFRPPAMTRTIANALTIAGSESGVGGWVNDVAPEQVAARLREVAT